MNTIAPAAAPDTSRLSLTAHYTSYIWYQNRLSHPALSSLLGCAFYHALRIGDFLCERFARRPSLAQSLVARHTLIDQLLEDAIEAGEVDQVFEVASGLSPRAWRFARRYPEIKFVEGDLGPLARYKHQTLARTGLLARNHTVVPVNALATGGAESIVGVANELLSRSGRTVIITEGLLGYFGLAEVSQIWNNVAAGLRAAGGGQYFSELMLRCDTRGVCVAPMIRRLMALFTHGTSPHRFEDPQAVETAITGAGFSGSRLYRCPDERQLLRILKATVTPAARTLAAPVAPEFPAAA